MTEAELHEAAARYHGIKRLKEDLKVALQELAFVNKHVRSGGVYPTHVSIKKEERYNERTTTLINLDAGIIQQHCVNVVAALRREIIKLGGEI